MAARVEKVVTTCTADSLRRFVIHKILASMDEKMNHAHILFNMLRRPNQVLPEFGIAENGVGIYVKKASVESNESYGLLLFDNFVGLEDIVLYCASVGFYNHDNTRRTALRSLALRCIKCNEDVDEDILHKHLRIRHGLARAGVLKERNPQQRPSYRDIRVKVNADNMSSIFIRFADKVFNETNEALTRNSEDVCESLPVQKLALTDGRYTLAIKSGSQGFATFNMPKSMLPIFMEGLLVNEHFSGFVDGIEATEDEQREERRDERE